MWQLAEDEDLTMFDDQCDQCGFLLHVVRDGVPRCIPTDPNDE